MLSSALLMRVGFVHLVTLPLVLTYCGAKQDLLIGEVAPAVTGEGGSNVTPGAGVGGETSGTGGAQGGASGSGGSTAEAGAAGADSMAGAAGAGEDCTEGEEPPLDSLIHRWSFDGTGSDVIDSIGNKNGTVQGGAMLDGSGVLALAGNRDGQPDQYVDLPNDLISGLSQVTIVAWTTWQGGAGYQRIFDFGISDMGEQQGGSGRSYLAVMPSTGFASTGLGAELVAPGYKAQQLPTSADIEDKLSVVALSMRSANNVELFLDGKLLSSIPTPIALSDIEDKNVWIGESQWSKDHCYHGTFDEFRIYSSALNACQLRTIISRGHNAL